MLEVSIRDELVRIRCLLDELVHLIGHLASPDQRTITIVDAGPPANRSSSDDAGFHGPGKGNARLMCQAV
jgi:hypothetical protein